MLQYCFYTTSIPLLYHFFTASVPLLYRFYTVSIPLLYCFYTASLPFSIMLLYRFYTASLLFSIPLLYQFYTASVLHSEPVLETSWCAQRFPCNKKEANFKEKDWSLKKKMLNCSKLCYSRPQGTHKNLNKFQAIGLMGNLYKIYTYIYIYELRALLYRFHLFYCSIFFVHY